MSLLKRILRKLGLAAPEPKPEPTPRPKPAPKPAAKKAEPAAEPAPAEAAAEAPTDGGAAEAAPEAPAKAAETKEPAKAEKPAETADKPAPAAPSAEPAARPTPLTAAEVAGKDVLVPWLDRLATELATLAELAGVPEDRRESFAKGQEDEDAEKRVRSGRHWTPRLRTPLKSAKDGTPKAVARGLISDAHAAYGALVQSFETGDERDEAVAQLGNLIPHVAGTVAAWGDKPSEARASDAVLAELRAAVAA